MYNQPIAFGEQFQDAVKSYWNKNKHLMDPKDQIAAEVADDINIATDAADEAEQNSGQEGASADASTPSEAVNAEDIVQDVVDNEEEVDGEDVM